jgi:hypothetical protein
MRNREVGVAQPPRHNLQGHPLLSQDLRAKLAQRVHGSILVEPLRRGPERQAQPGRGNRLASGIGEYVAVADGADLLLTLVLMAANLKRRGIGGP